MADLRYISISELKNQIPEKLQGMLANDVVGSNDPDQATAAAIIKSTALGAESMFESYMAKRYKLPLIYEPDSTVAEQIKSTIVTITKYKLYARRDALTPAIQEQFRDALNWIKDIANGNANVVQLNGSDKVVDDGDEPEIQVGTGNDFKNSQFNVIP